MATKTVKSTIKPKITITKLYSGMDDAAGEIVVPIAVMVIGFAAPVKGVVKQVITRIVRMSIFDLLSITCHS
jgi:hypothetical protein